LLTIAVLQPIVSPLLSISWRLITPYIRPFCFKNDGTVVTLARTAFDASCAAMVPQFLYAHSGLVFRQLPKLYARELHKLVRRYARIVRTAVVRLAMNLPGCRSSGAALCCALSHQGWWPSRCQLLLLTRWSLANCVHGSVQCEWQGETRLRFQTAWSVRTSVCRVLCKDTREMHALSDPTATRMHS
jgi:hypothetical protein